MVHPATQLAATTNDTNTMLRLTLIVSRLLESNDRDKHSLCDYTSFSVTIAVECRRRSIFLHVGSNPSLIRVLPRLF